MSMEQHPASVIRTTPIAPDGNQKVCSFHWSKRRIVLHLLAWWLISLLGWQSISQTQAEGIPANVSGTSLHTSQDIYAYANVGERIRFETIKVTGGTDASFTMTVYGPNGQIGSPCIIAAGAANGFDCLQGINSVSVAGIYTLRIVRAAAASNTTNTTNAKITWDVEVQTAGLTPIAGRVYVKSLTTYDAGNPHTFNLRFVSEYGYRYLATYTNFAGIYSTISADAYGVRLPNSCVSAYQSIEANDPAFTPPNANCGGLYKIFFNTPNAALPASSNRWDYTTGQQVVDWINPTIQTPTVSGLTYTSTSLMNRAGNFSFTVANFSGNALFQIDVNHNGSYTDAVDRIIDFNAVSGSNTIAWDGRDGTGALVSCSQAVQARVLINREAEIHFTMYDVEGLGSLAVTRQNGTGSPNSTLYWDDSKLGTTGRCAAANPTSPLSATAGVISSGGVHGWNFPGTCSNAGTWGDARYIDNWAYATSSAQATIEVPLQQPGSLTASVTSLTTCSGGEVAINYTATPAGSSVLWNRMPGNRTGIGNVQDFPTATGTTPVSYTYTAYIPSVSGCESNTVTTVVTVNPVPIVTPSVCSQTICSGQTGNITFISSVPGSTIHWERTPTTPAPSSGTGDISQSFINTGPTSVTYTYKVWAESPAPASCPSSATITCEIVVTPGLTVSATANSATVCVGSPLSLSAAATPAGSYTYTWTGPNGYIGSGANPTVSATAAITQSGTYTVVVTDATGCSGTATVPITVTACCDLVASVEPTSVTSCVSPNTGALSILYTGTGTYQYSLNGGVFQALGASPVTITNLAAGSYTVVVQALGDPSCSQTFSTTINSPSTPNVFALSNSPLCTSSTLSLSATGSFTSYSWTGPNGFVSSQQNPTIPNATTLASGVYTVNVVDAAGCTASASTTVIIANQPSLTVTAGPSLTVCSGQSTSLTVGGSNGAPVTWTNNLGQSGTGTTINFPGVTNLSGQPAVITYVISAAAGPCSDTETVEIIVNPAPVLQVVPQNSNICALEETQIVATAIPSNATINWTRTPATPDPPASSGTGTGSVTVNQSLPAGNYTYSFTATAGGCTSSPVVSQITVNN